MSTQSANLGLDKRGANDNFSNTKLNENWDKIDAEIGSDAGGGSGDNLLRTSITRDFSFVSSYGCKFVE